MQQIERPGILVPAHQQQTERMLDFGVVRLDRNREYAQEMAAHESPRRTKLYDGTKEPLTQDEMERIRL